jgi:hypothetical protein
MLVKIDTSFELSTVFIILFLPRSKNPPAGFRPADFTEREVHQIKKLEAVHLVPVVVYQTPLPQTALPIPNIPCIP